jgi:hypothetical protein
MQLPVLRKFPVQAPQKFQPFVMAMPGVTLAYDLAVQDAQCRKKRRPAIALVIVRHSSTPALLEGQPRLGAIQRLNLALLVQTPRQRLFSSKPIDPSIASHFRLFLVMSVTKQYRHKET